MTAAENHRRANSRWLRWLVIGLSIACGAAWSYHPLSGAGDRLACVPLTMNEFKGIDVALTERELKVLGSVDVVHRKYTDGNRSIFLTLVDGSRDRHAVHD